MSTPSATGPSENRPTTTSDEVEVNLETEESAQDQSEDKNLKKIEGLLQRYGMILHERI